MLSFARTICSTCFVNYFFFCCYVIVNSCYFYIMNLKKVSRIPTKCVESVCLLMCVFVKNCFNVTS